jgi:GTP cyclohydrolase I
MLCQIENVGLNELRPGLVETPDRVAKAWNEWGAGYSIDPATILKTFEDGAENYDEMVIVKDLPFFSTCEHHMAPFFGTAAIAYVPNGRVVGLSKLGRLLECFSRRLQVQERITQQITAALDEHLKPKGSACILTARHLCMESRGLSKIGATTVTSSLTGVFRDTTVRAEFIALATANG